MRNPEQRLRVYALKPPRAGGGFAEKSERCSKRKSSGYRGSEGRRSQLVACVSDLGLNSGSRSAPRSAITASSAAETGWCSAQAKKPCQTGYPVCPFCVSGPKRLGKISSKSALHSIICRLHRVNLGEAARPFWRAGHLQPTPYAALRRSAWEMSCDMDAGSGAIGVIRNSALFKPSTKSSISPRLKPIS